MFIIRRIFYLFIINHLQGHFFMLKTGRLFSFFVPFWPENRPFYHPGPLKSAKNGLPCPVFDLGPFFDCRVIKRVRKFNLRPFAGFLSRPATAWAWALPTINFRSLAGLRGFPCYPGGGRTLRPVLGLPGAKFGQFSERRALNLRINGSRAGAFANPSGGSGRPNFIL